MSEVTSERRNCSHHWVIQPADGPVSLGVCKFCRETREFKNSLEVWGRDLRFARVGDGQGDE